MSSQAPRSGGSLPHTHCKDCGLVMPRFAERTGFVCRCSHRTSGGGDVALSNSAEAATNRASSPDDHPSARDAIEARLGELERLRADRRDLCELVQTALRALYAVDAAMGLNDPAKGTRCSPLVAELDKRFVAILARAFPEPTDIQTSTFGGDAFDESRGTGGGQ